LLLAALFTLSPPCYMTNKVGHLAKICHVNYLM